MTPFPSAARALPAAAVLLLAACAPSLDWREVRPEGSGALLLFPCKPSQVSREVTLAGAPARLTLHACRAGEVTWALAWAELADPSRVAPALAELRRAAAENVRATEGAPLPLAVAGATPQPGSVRVPLQGRMPDGRVAHEQVALFARGTRVYQATAVGERPADEAMDTFFASLRAPG